MVDVAGWFVLPPRSAWQWPCLAQSSRSGERRYGDENEMIVYKSFFVVALFNVCVCMCMCVCVWAHMFACVQACEHACMHECVCVCVCVRERE